MLQLIIRRGLKRKGQFCLENYPILFQQLNQLKYVWVKVKVTMMIGFVLLK